MIGGMDHRIPISQDELLRQAAEVFEGAALENIPAKLWVDYWVAGSQLYLRATFDAGISKDARQRIARLGELLERVYGVSVLTVCYRQDHAWEAIEGWNRTLNQVV